MKEEYLVMSQKERKYKSMLDMLSCGAVNLRDASIRLGISYRQMRRLSRSYNASGDEGLVHKSRGKKQIERDAIKSAVMDIYLTFRTLFEIIFN